MLNTKRSAFPMLCCLCLTVLLTIPGCSSSNPSALPAKGLAKLDERIFKLAGQEIDYVLASVQEATKGEEGTDFSGNITMTSNSNAVNGCPQVYTGKGLWCVVLGQPIEAQNGESYSHFLIEALGENWYVDELSDSQMNEFTEAGCQNWILASE